MPLIHATCVALEHGAVLLRAREGGGKSDLALRLIDAGARLVADDQVMVDVDGATMIASAPEAIAGKLEVRGLGIVAEAPASPTPVIAVIDLQTSGEIDRMPEAETCEIEGVTLPLFRLHPFEPSAPAKARMMVAVAAGVRAVER